MLIFLSMEHILPSDFLEVDNVSIISNLDKDVLLDLYQPLIGSKATMLYLTLYKQSKDRDDEELLIIEDLLSFMNISTGELLLARQALEGVGLIETYLKEENNLRYFLIKMFSPKTPKDFFDDILFNGLLISYVGEKNAKRLAFKYAIYPRSTEGYVNVSASFRDIFNPNYDSKAFRTNLGIKTMGHDEGKVRYDFNKEIFYQCLNANTQIDIDAINKDDILEIERLASLLNINEEEMVNIVNEIYNPFIQEHINYEKLFDASIKSLSYPTRKRAIVRKKAEVYSSSQIADKIRLFDAKTPLEMLSLLKDNTQPAEADIKILNFISRKYGLPNNVINPILDYCLSKNNGILSRNYIDKIASNVASEKIDNAVDAMNYLNRVSQKAHQKQTSAIKPKVEKAIDNPKDEILSAEEQAIVDEFFKK